MRRPRGRLYSFDVTALDNKANPNHDLLRTEFQEEVLGRSNEERLKEAKIRDEAARAFAPPSPATHAISRPFKAGETVCQTLFAP